MKVLVATKTAQGMRKNDFCHATEDELVMFGSECDGEKVDGKCGCRRALVGVTSACATTTFKIVERADLTPEKLHVEIREALRRGGWITDTDAADWEGAIAEQVDNLTRCAEAAPVGTIVEKRGHNFQVRERAPKGGAA